MAKTTALVFLGAIAVALACSYEFQGRTYDLSHLHKLTRSAEHVADQTLDHDFYLNFCGAVHTGVAACNGMGACGSPYNAPDTDYYPMGRVDQVSIEEPSDQEITNGARFTLMYRDGEDPTSGIRRQTATTMYCSSDATTPKIRYTNMMDNGYVKTYFFTLHDAKMCVGGGSGKLPLGEIAFVVFVVVMLCGCLPVCCAVGVGAPTVIVVGVVFREQLGDLIGRLKGGDSSFSPLDEEGFNTEADKPGDSAYTAI